MARTTILTAELGARICEDVAAGNPVETAAEANGVSRSSVYEWIQKGAEDIPPYSEFSEAVTRARGLASKRVQSHLQNAIPEDPKSALEWLKRREQRLWDPPKQVVVSGVPDLVRDDGPVDTHKEIARLEGVLAALKSQLQPLNKDQK